VRFDPFRHLAAGRTHLIQADSNASRQVNSLSTAFGVPLGRGR